MSLIKTFEILSRCFVVLALVIVPPRESASGEPQENVSDSFTYRLALPGRRLTFPADHHAHPDFKTEWWYYTGHLITESGRRFGYQVTFFRYGVRDRQSGLKDPPLFTELYMAHFALSDTTQKKFFFRERINRGYGDRAGAAIDRYLVWNEDWKVEADQNNHRIAIRDRGVKLDLVLRSLKPPALHGDNGHSQKGEGVGRASYYYSLTRLETSGTLSMAGRVETVRGSSWMDHEFGSNQLGDDQVGWDWFSIQLDDQRELMLYQMRRRDGSIDPYSSGSSIGVSGARVHLTNKDFQIEVLEHWRSPKSGARYPIKWKVAIPSQGIELEIQPAFSDQELITNRSTRVTYWEGAVAIRGMAAGKPISGNGYVEMTGYAGKVTI